MNRPLNHPLTSGKHLPACGLKFARDLEIVIQVLEFLDGLHDDTVVRTDEIDETVAIDVDLTTGGRDDAVFGRLEHAVGEGDHGVA